ncbi:hypothetical protein [Microlunatus flavus]|uniref:Sensor n=1 Tax=Microlunatus flavus TaxID=1036181 RepID=A0A1H9DPE9_9ACTN|nr:hypothetical protein [Microlunatus flavus]SEQ14578.1 hypothetical protein SAMN05421756_102589 [Microlunatus flavus]
MGGDVGGDVGGGADGADQAAQAARLALVRDETRFELGLLHDRVNALLAAEAFLTIAYTAAMSNGASWGAAFAAVAAPVLALLGLLLALLALPGVGTTVRIVLALTAQQDELFARLRGSAVAYHGAPGRPAALDDQRRSLLFFRAVPVLFAVVWVVLGVLALVLVS